MTANGAHGLALHQRIGLIAGPVSAAAMALWFSPDGLSREGALVAALGVWMAIWWSTEAIPVAITAFLPLILLPILDVTPIRDAASPYAHPIIYLFFGGFVVAVAIERSGLHRRMALAVFRLAGANARSLIGGFMLAAALVSMWISNTSTTLMLLPIAISLATVIGETMPGLSARERSNFGTALLLGLAYGATLGGVSTLIGTPPNAFMVGFMAETYDREVAFARWMLIGVPISLVLLPIAWVTLTRFVFPVSFRATPEAIAHIATMRSNLGPMSKAEQRTGLLFILLVFGWLFRGQLAQLPILSGLTDTGIAMIAAMAAFIIPSGDKGRSLVSWNDMAKLPWGVLILFGGGLSLAAAVSHSGLAPWIGQLLQGSPLTTLPPWVVILAFTALVIALTELTSNLATTATFLPVIAAIAVESRQDPLLLVIPVTVAASCAFMLPVATPPNAIMFSSGMVSIPRMMRAGVVLNIIAVFVLSVASIVLAPMVFS